MRAQIPLCLQTIQGWEWQNSFFGGDTSIKVITGIISDPNAQDSEGSVCNNSNIQVLINRVELVELSNLALRAEVCKLTNRIVEIDSKNLILKQQFNDTKNREILHPPGDSLHAEFLDFKNKQDEFPFQQALFKQEAQTQQESSTLGASCKGEEEHNPSRGG
jgi:hypothetical protein